MITVSERRAAIGRAKLMGESGPRRTQSLTRAETQNIRLNANFRKALDGIRQDKMRTIDLFSEMKLKLFNDMSDIKAVTTKSANRLRDRHEGLTPMMASKRVLKPMVIDAYYLNGVNRYALRRTQKMSKFASVGFETKMPEGKLPAPGIYARQDQYFTRQDDPTLVLSDCVRTARHLLQSLDLEKMANGEMAARERMRFKRQYARNTRTTDLNFRRPSFKLKEQSEYEDPSQRLEGSRILVMPQKSKTTLDESQLGLLSKAGFAAGGGLKAAPLAQIANQDHDRFHHQHHMRDRMLVGHESKSPHEQQQRSYTRIEESDHDDANVVSGHQNETGAGQRPCSRSHSRHYGAKKRLLPATPDTGQFLVERASRRIHAYLSKMDEADRRQAEREAEAAKQAALGRLHTPNSGSQTPGSFY